uniref:Uncharacterized protein n=1 Tax=Davidia involucrata TaxID=16924 RepID=A0A5B7A396_DAVIN
METSLRHLKAPLSIPRTRNSSILSQPIHTQHLYCLPPGNRSSLQWPNQRSLTAVNCTKGGPVSVPELGRQLEDEMGSAAEEEEWMGIWREKCKGNGIVELMECLEREAIMGDDEGREPSDYNRRAHIFDKSSRVFQALKERNTDPL